MSKSNEYCCVPDCKSMARKNPNVSFHLFTRLGQKIVYNGEFGRAIVDRQKLWAIKLKIGKKVTPRMVICSRHFTEDDYIRHAAGHVVQKKYLKKNAVTSRNLPAQKTVVKVSSRKLRAEAREKTIEPPCYAEKCNENEPSSEELVAAEALVSLLNEQPHIERPVTFKDFSCQVNAPKTLTICDLIKTMSALTSFTGLQSFDILNFIVDSVSKVYKDVRIHKLTVKERIILTLIKLKCDLSFVTLAILFQISSSLCKNYFTDMIQIIHQSLQCAVPFPTKAEIDANLPKCFNKFNDTQIVVDCTEIFVQKPTCLCCRIRFYSNYKSAQTVKIMLGVTPAGLISFVSKPYGGRASDKTIFEQSGLISKLDSDSAVMADKGFLIEDVCYQNKIKLYRPPFLRKIKQLSEKESIFNNEIAAARVHVERTNQRIKIFKILSGKLQWTLVEYFKEIVYVICAITNLSSPILGEDKF